jgi:hypothetical protein
MKQEKINYFVVLVMLSFWFALFHRTIVEVVLIVFVEKQMSISEYANWVYAEFKGETKA